MRFAVAVRIVTMGSVGMSVIVDLRAAVVAEECHEQQAEHVERSHERGDHADQPVTPSFRDAEYAFHRISSLLQNPANGGIPAIASVAMPMVRNVHGI